MIKGKYAAEVIKYAEDVSSGLIIAGEYRIKSCKRFLDDISSEKWQIKTKDADFVIGIIEKTFKHRQGQDMHGNPLRGKPFLLEPWEKFIIYGILIFYIPGTIERRIKEALIFVPRKNGKTIFVSALAWALGLLERLSGSTVYVVGAVLKEAMKSYENWNYNITRVLYPDKKNAQEDGWRILDNNMEHSISHDDLDGGSLHLEALAGNPDSQDSFNANIVIADEIHAYKSPKQYNILKEATKAYTNKLVIGITTAGDKMVSFCYYRLQYCKKVLDGTVSDDAYFIFICQADQSENGDVDYTNPIQHEKANPNYGVTIRPADIYNDSMQAQNDPQQRKDFFAKSLNIYTTALKAYFDIETFRMSDRKYRWTIDDLSKLPIKWYGGADLSRMYDLTAAALVGNYEGVDIIIPHAWFPIVQAAAKAEQDGIPLFGWKDDGWLDMCNTPTVNAADIVNWFIAMRKRGFQIAQIGFDRKFSDEFFVLSKGAGLNIQDEPQYYYNKSQGFRRIEKSALDGNLYYLHSDAYEYCVQNVRAIEKTDDMIQYEKVDGDGGVMRIDIFDASVFASVRMIKDAQKSKSASKWLNG
ncbi:MAG: terminase large subunit [Anaerofustis sp.]